MTKKLTVEEFNGLSRNEKKVLVAQDVLNQLRTQRIVAQSGNYINVYIPLEDEKKSARENLTVIKGCHVCGIGACMVSVTKFANKLTLGELESFDSSNKALKLLRSVFTKKELAYVEVAFEGRQTGYLTCATVQEQKPEVIQKIVDSYYFKYAGTTARLRAIMRNFIRNNGEFIIP